MWALFVGLTFGLLASARSDTTAVKSRSCSHVGVFHVEGLDRYLLTYGDAKALCLSLGAELATEDQLRTAYASKMETCRYGWTANMSIAILRHTPHEKCYLNQTGFGTRAVNSTELSDAFCYNDSDVSSRNCENAINPLSTKPDSNDTTATAAPSSDVGAEITYSPDEATGVTELEPDLLGGHGDLTTTEEPDQHFEPTLDVMETDAPTHVPELNTDVGVIAERGFNNSEEALDGDQVTRPTEVTRLTLPDDSTGSGILPSSEESFTIASDAPLEEVKTAEPEVERPPVAQPEPQPEPKPESNTESVRHGRKVEHNGKPEEKEGNDWLVIIGVVVAIAAIVLVCAAVATRKRWCGKHQTLNISKNSAEGNGAAAAVVGSRAEEREQEMVTLMNKEKIQENGNAEEFTGITVEGSSEKA